MENKKMTVRNATFTAYNMMPDEFHLLLLVEKVRQLLSRPHLNDATISRRLRELSADGLLRYEVINNHKSLYKKIKENQLKLF